MIEAVTFDYWNTLCYEPAPGYLRDRRVDAWLGLLEDAGFATERAALHDAFARAWDLEVARWTAGEHIAYTEAADVRATPHVAEAVAALKAAGLRIGIVCDVGFTPSVVLRKHLDRHGLLASFDHWSFSDEVGCYKPSPVIFEHALAGLGADPATTAHVGDLRRTDVAGAIAMGMTAVRYTGIHDDDSQPEPEGHHTIADHRDLPVVLGVVPH
jgi:HAD superfamily hydrolase (TIGR01549 family)